MRRPSILFLISSSHISWVLSSFLCCSSCSNTIKFFHLKYGVLNPKGHILLSHPVHSHAVTNSPTSPTFFRCLQSKNNPGEWSTGACFFFFWGGSAWNGGLGKEKYPCMKKHRKYSVCRN